MSADRSIRIDIVARDMFTRVAYNITRSVRMLNSAFGGLGTSTIVIGGVATAVAGLGVALVSAANTFAEFEYAIARAVIGAGIFGSEAEAVTTQLEDIARVAGSEFRVGMTNAANALVTLTKAGFTAEEATNALDSALQLSIISGTSTANAAVLLVQALRVFGLEAEDSAKAVDALVAADLASIATAATTRHRRHDTAFFMTPRGITLGAICEFYNRGPSEIGVMLDQDVEFAVGYLNAKTNAIKHARTGKGNVGGIRHQRHRVR